MSIHKHDAWIDVGGTVLVERRGSSKKRSRACRATLSSAASRNAKRCSLSVSQSIAESGRGLGVERAERVSSPRDSESRSRASRGSSGASRERNLRRSRGSRGAKTTSANVPRPPPPRATRDDENASRSSRARGDGRRKMSLERRGEETPSPRCRWRGADRIPPRSSDRARRETRLRNRAISATSASGAREDERGCPGARASEPGSDDADEETGDGKRDEIRDVEALDLESDAYASTRLTTGSSRAPSRSSRPWRLPRSRRSTGSSGVLRERRDEVSARVSRSSSRVSLERVVSTRRVRVSQRRRSRRSRRSSRSRASACSRTSCTAIASRSRASLCSRSWRSRWRVCVRDSMRSRRSVKRSSSRSSRTNASRSAPAEGLARGDAEDAAASRLLLPRDNDAIAVSRPRARNTPASVRIEHAFAIVVSLLLLVFQRENISRVPTKRDRVVRFEKPDRPNFGRPKSICIFRGSVSAAAFDVCTDLGNFAPSGLRGGGK